MQSLGVMVHTVEKINFNPIYFSTCFLLNVALRIEMYWGQVLILEYFYIDCIPLIPLMADSRPKGPQLRLGHLRVGELQL